jgi:D-xylose transport system substrate-binding protein
MASANVGNILISQRMRWITRRAILRGGLSLLALPLVAACSQPAATPATTQAPAAPATPAPNADKPAAATSTPAAVPAAAATTLPAPAAAATSAPVTVAPAVAKGGKIRIGAAMRTQMEPRWQYEIDIMSALAKEQNVDLLVQWANDDVSAQASQVENLLSQGINCLIIVAVDSNIAATFVDNAHKSNVPVISYDIGILNAAVDYYTTRDNKQAAQLQVNGGLKFSSEGNWVLVKGDTVNNAAHDQDTTWHAALQPYVDSGKIKIVSEQWNKSWTAESALKQAENALTANNNDVKVFLTGNDDMATGVAQAIKAQNLGGKVYISGLDAGKANDQLVVQGIQTMTVWTKIDDMARSAFKAATDLAQGQKPQFDTMTNNGKADVPTKLIDSVEVNKDNMCEFITKVAPKGWISAQDVYVDGNIPATCKV